MHMSRRFLKGIIIILPILILIGIMGCQCDHGTNPGDESPALTEMQKQLVASSNHFGFDLFARLQAARRDTNLLVSPLSVSMALGMTYNGAAGATAEAMQTVLGYQGMDKAEINQAYRGLMDSQLNGDPKVQFEIANALFGRQGIAFEPAFFQTVQTSFDAEVRDLDFSDSASVDTINAWIEAKTQGLIEDMLDQIPGNAVLYLINALYFKADWTRAFDAEKTEQGSFWTADGQEVTCPMMQRSDTLLYAETDRFQMVDLPYGQGRFSMTMILPKPGVGLNAVVADMNAAAWDDWIAQLRETEMDLAMPRFKLEDKASLVPVLDAMGMGPALGAEADFSGMHPTLELFINRIRHQTFIEVDEIGTEAAAATIVEINYKGAGTRMNLCRPFLFVIRDRENGALLFMGAMQNPTA